MTTPLRFPTVDSLKADDFRRQFARGVWVADEFLSGRVQSIHWQ